MLVSVVAADMPDLLASVARSLRGGLRVLFAIASPYLLAVRSSRAVARALLRLLSSPFSSLPLTSLLFRALVSTVGLFSPLLGVY